MLFTYLRLYFDLHNNNIVFTNSMHQPQSDDDDELPLFRTGFLVGFIVGLLSGVHHCLLLVGILVGFSVGLGGGGGFGVGDHHSPPPLSPPSHLSRKHLVSSYPSHCALHKLLYSFPSQHTGLYSSVHTQSSGPGFHHCLVGMCVGRGVGL